MRLSIWTLGVVWVLLALGSQQLRAVEVNACDSVERDGGEDTGWSEATYRSFAIRLAWGLGSYDEAVPLLQEMVQEEDHSLVHLLGMAYEHGLGVQADTARALELYTAGAQRDNVDAQVALGMLLMSVEGMESERALYWFQRAMDGGSGEAAIMLGGEALSQGRFAQAYSFSEKAIELGYISAGKIMTQFLETDFDLDEHAAKGSEILERSAKAGSHEACRCLGMRYEAGYGVPRSYERARAWYDSALAHTDEVDTVTLARRAHCAKVLSRYGSDAQAVREEPEQSYFALRYEEDMLIKSGMRALIAQRYRDAYRLFDGAAARGNSDAYMLMGGMHLSGILGSEDHKKGIELMLKSASMGNLNAIFKLGEMCYMGKYGVGAPDAEQAVQLVTKAAEGGVGEAQLRLGMHYETGDGVLRNYRTAVQWYEKAAKQEVDGAQERLKACRAKLVKPPQRDVNYVLGLLHPSADELLEEVQGESGLTRVLYWRAAADLGSHQAEYWLGISYDEGKNGLSEDKEKALKWFRKAANSGLADGQFTMAVYYVHGYAGLPISMAEAAKWFRKAADQGNAAAQYNLGLMYKMGEGVSKNPAISAQWYRKAAAAGMSDAKYQLAAYYYYDDDGIENDYREAFRLCRDAAQAGVVGAKYLLGQLYHRGDGVAQNLEESFKWFKQAADEGDQYAQHRVGEAYEFGYGVRKDWAQAVEYYRKSALQGNQRARERLAKASVKW